MIYTGTTGPIGGSEIFGGGAFTVSVAIAGVTVGMSVAVSPRTFPGNGVYWTGYVSAPGVVTVKVGATIALFVTASIYDVQVNDGTGGGGGTVTAVTGVPPIASSGGNTPAISIALATTGAPGAVQPDGTSITISAGVISAAGSSGVTAVTGTAPIVSSGGATPAISVTTATTGAVGVVKPDGVTIDVSAGVISVPTATTGALGLVKPDGTSITISAGVISAPGSGVTAVTGTAPIVSSGGATPAISVTTATTGAVGVVKPDGVTIDVSAGVISVPTATTGALGLVQPDGTSITVASGVISAAASGALSLISKQTVSVAAASITFAAIPATFTHLLLVWNGRCTFVTANAQGLQLNFNGDVATDYNYQNTFANGSGINSSATSAAATIVAGLITGLNATANYASGGEMKIYSYANTTFFKNVVSGCAAFDSSSGSALQWLEAAGQWLSTAAISSIVLTVAGGGLFAVGSVFSLYGIS